MAKVSGELQVLHRVDRAQGNASYTRSTCVMSHPKKGLRPGQPLKSLCLSLRKVCIG